MYLNYSGSIRSIARGRSFYRRVRALNAIKSFLLDSGSDNFVGLRTKAIGMWWKGY